MYVYFNRYWRRNIYHHFPCPCFTVIHPHKIKKNRKKTKIKFHSLSHSCFLRPSVLFVCMVSTHKSSTGKHRNIYTEKYWWGCREIVGNEKKTRKTLQITIEQKQKKKKIPPTITTFLY